MRRHLLRAVLLATVAALAACDSKDSNPTTPSPTVSSVSISPATDFLKLKAQERFTLTAQLSTGATEQVTATWGSDNTAVATVDSGGLVTAVGVGAATISAEYQGRRATRSIRVLPDYAGLWVGDFFVASCEVQPPLPGSFCNPILRTTFPARLDIVQTSNVVSGTWTLQEDATGTVTGDILDNGHLRLTGSVFLGGVTTSISDWDSVTSDNQTMTGGFTLNWSAAGGAARTRVELRNFRR